MTVHWLWFAIPISTALLFFIGYLYQSIGAARDEIRFPPIGDLIDVGGRKLHMICKGSGIPTVVFESGVGADSSLWWRHQDELAKLTTVCVYDRAGLGWSDPAPIPRTMVERAAELHTLLVNAKVPGPYVLVGASLGGLLIRLFARNHRDEIAGMVFVDAAHETVFAQPNVVKNYPRLVGVFFKVLAYSSLVGILRILRVRHLPLPPRGRSAKSFAEALPVFMSAVQEHILGSRFQTTHSYFVGADDTNFVKEIAKTMTGLDRPGLLGNLPVVVISHGIPYPPGPAAMLENNHRQGQEHLAALSANSEIVVAEQSGHVISRDQPELVRDAVRRVVNAARRNSETPTEENTGTGKSFS